MELDFDKFCVIDDAISPTTVLKPPRNSSKTASKKISGFPPKQSKDFREITFNRYRSASCRNAPRSSNSNDSALLKKRGSVYQSSKEVNSLSKNDYGASERKKIEFSRETASSEIPFNIIDKLCISDENQCTTSSSCKNQNELSSKKASDPFLRSKAKPRSAAENSPAHLSGTLKIHHSTRGAPSFEFFVKSPEELYTAKTWRVENELTRVYTFHSLHHHRRKSNAGVWGHRESCRVSNALGQMHASCYLRTDTVLTEFVLYDVSAQSKSSKPIPLIDLRSVQEISAIAFEDPIGNEGISDISRRGRMNVVVPRGSHGSPSTGEIGPNGLFERWRLGGGCDCGGWDMACPLNVLGRSSIPRLRKEPSPVEIFCLGKKDDDIPAFTMRWTEEGKYAVNFHAQLSSLQAFSICVAILDSETEESSILGHVRSKQTPQSDSLRVFPEEEIKNLIDALSTEDEEDEEGRLKLGEKRQQAQTFLVNPPFSPIARA